MPLVVASILVLALRSRPLWCPLGTVPTVGPTTRLVSQVATRDSESHSASRGMPTPTFQVKATTRDGEAPAAITRFHKSSKFSLGGDFH